MYKLTIILMIVLAILLIIAVLLQNSKSDGMNNSLGAMGGNQLMGVKKTANALEQVTWGLGISLFILAIVATLILKKEQQSHLDSINVSKAAEQLTIQSELLDNNNAKDSEQTSTEKETQAS